MNRGDLATEHPLSFTPRFSGLVPDLRRDETVSIENSFPSVQEPQGAGLKTGVNERRIASRPELCRAPLLIFI